MYKIFVITLMGILLLGCIDSSSRPTDKQRTKGLVFDLSRGIHDFKTDNGYIPKDDKECIFKLLSVCGKNAPYLCNGRGTWKFVYIFAGGIFLFDAWDRQIRYIYVKDNNDNNEHFLVYSWGENRIDEKGKGDDIVKTDYVYWSEKDNSFIIDQEAKAAGIPTDEYRKTHPWPTEEKK